MFIGGKRIDQLFVLLIHSLRVNAVYCGWTMNVLRCVCPCLNRKHLSNDGDGTTSE